MKIDVAAAAALLRRVERSFVTGVGDCRSNETVWQLLQLSKALLSERLARDQLAASADGSERMSEAAMPAAPAGADACARVP